MSLSEDHSTTLAGMACLFVDGCLDDVTRQWDFPGFPSYPVLGSGITEGHRCGEICVLRVNSICVCLHVCLYTCVAQRWGNMALY